MKIRKLFVNHYKVFDNLKLDFTDIRDKTLDNIVIAGLNGSGKTTILELIKDILSGNIIKDVAGDFIIEIEYDFGKIYKIIFEFLEKNKTKFECEFSFNKSFLTLKYNQQNTKKLHHVHIFKDLMEFVNPLMKEYQEKTTVIYRYSHDKIRKKRPINSNNIVTEVSFNNYKDDMKNLIVKPILQTILKNRNVSPNQVIEKEIDTLNEIFKGIKINSRFADIDSEELIFLSPNGQRIVFEKLSSGEKFIYFMGFFLKRLNVNNSMILIDEPEESLHPTWQNKLIKFYSNIGKNNQVIFATHSPHIIGSVKSQNVFLFKLENKNINISQPKYSKGHSISYVLSEIMETDYRNTYINNVVTKYLELINKGEHETTKGKILFNEIQNLDPNSEERIRVNMSLRRYKYIGR